MLEKYSLQQCGLKDNCIMVMIIKWKDIKDDTKGEENHKTFYFALDNNNLKVYSWIKEVSKSQKQLERMYNNHNDGAIFHMSSDYGLC